MDVLTLDSGLTVVVEAMPGLEHAALALYLPVGAAEDPSDAGGLAHLVEHLAFAGSAHAPGRAWEDTASAAGVSTNAWTDRDGMMFTAELPAGAVATQLALEVDRLVGLAGGDPATELGVIDAERAWERGPGGLVDAWVWSLLWPEDHPLARRPIGDAAPLANLSAAAVYEAARLRLVPEGATLALVGDVGVDAVRGLLDERLPRDTYRVSDVSLLTLGPMSTPVRAWLPQDVDRRRVLRAWRAPARGDPELPAVELLAGMIGATLDVTERGGRLVLERADGLRVLRRIRRSGVTDAALDVVRGRIARADAASVARLAGRAQARALCQAWTGSPECLDAARAARAAVSASDLRRVASSWLAERSALTLAVVPERRPHVWRRGARADVLAMGPSPDPAPTAHGGASPPLADVTPGHFPPPRPARAPAPPRILSSAGGVTIDLPLPPDDPDASAAIVSIDLVHAAPAPAVAGALVHALRAATRPAEGVSVAWACDALGCRAVVDGPPALAAAGAREVSRVVRDVSARVAPLGPWRREALVAWRAAPYSPSALADRALETLLAGPPPDPAALRAVRGRHVRAAARGLEVAMVVSAGVSTPAVAGFASPPVPARPVPKRVIVVDAPLVEGVEVRIAFAAPAAGDPDAAAWALASHVLGGDAAARLDARLRAELGATYGARIHTSDATRPAVAVLSVRFTAASAEIGVAALARALDAPEVTRFDEADVVGARGVAWRRGAAARLDPRALVESVRSPLRAGLRPDATWVSLARLDGLRAADFERVSRRVFDGPRAWVLVGDAERVEQALDAAGVRADAIWSPRRATQGDPRGR